MWDAIVGEAAAESRLWQECARPEGERELIAVFGDTAIDAFVPPGKMSDAQLLEMEKSLVMAMQSKL